ncbi:MAG: hypothetical protein HZC02_05400 [Candidatus Levybacteria bacterium]|nr:hypothetical protein [Candidatus Levybacteria bacterium]
MTRTFFKDAILWGFFLWFVGYILGIFLFMVVPKDLLGWIIMPMGILITLWVLVKKVKGISFQYYFLLALFWVLLAIVCDYFFLVKVFKPTDGYYKVDVYIYYLLTCILPLFIGWRKTLMKEKKHL